MAPYRAIFVATQRVLFSNTVLLLYMTTTYDNSFPHVLHISNIHWSILKQGTGMCGRFSAPRVPGWDLEQWFPTLGHPGVLGLQLPETLISTACGEGFWELEEHLGDPQLGTTNLV